MHRPSTPESDRIGSLAQLLDCMSEADLCLLAEITPNTAESWRKRGKGPAYILFGNRFLYPRAAVADYLQTQLRERRPSLAAKELL